MIENRVNFLNKSNSKFSLTKGGFLCIETDGKTYERVNVIRAFPFTDPDCFISVRDMSMEEIGIIENLNQLDPDTVELITQQINIRYFTPKILKIISVKDSAGIAKFTCVTDKGDAEFSFKIGGESVARLNETRLIFTDLDGNRYEIPDISKLTPKEQKKLDLYI